MTFLILSLVVLNSILAGALFILTFGWGYYEGAAARMLIPSCFTYAAAVGFALGEAIKPDPNRHLWMVLVCLAVASTIAIVIAARNLILAQQQQFKRILADWDDLDQEIKDFLSKLDMSHRKETNE